MADCLSAWSNYVVVVDIFLEPFHYKIFFCNSSDLFKIRFFEKITIFEKFVLILEKSILEPSKINSIIQKSIPKHKIDSLYVVCLLNSVRSWELRLTCSHKDQFFWRFECLQKYKRKQIWRIKKKISGQLLNLNFEEVWWRTWKP